VKLTGQEAPHHAVFSNLPKLSSLLVANIFLSTLFSNTIYVLSV